MKDIRLLAAASLITLAATGGPARTCDAAKASPPAPFTCLGAHGTAVVVKTRLGGPGEIVASGAGTAAPRGVVRVTTLSGATDAAACDACANWLTCEEALSAAGAGTQIVPLKNGVMCVYTADSPRRAHEIQVLMARRQEYLASLASAGEKAHLCPFCRQMRGAVASGKLVREMINIDSGCILMTTSTDPALVSRIHSEVGAPPGRAKN